MKFIKVRVLRTLLAITTVATLSTAALSQTTEPIQPLPLEVKQDPRKVALGEKLFFDKRVSEDGSIACVACHGYNTGGADRTPLSLGIGGQKGAVNAPSIFNLAFNFRYSWDGRNESLEDQIGKLMGNPKVMGTTWEKLSARLNGQPDYAEQFTAIFGEPANAKNIGEAFVAFERSLVTPNARFDKFLRGDKNALTSDEQKGYEKFKNYGCIACHQGINVGGNMFQVFGVMGDYFAKRGNPSVADLGRYNQTKLESDKHVFRVPSLRNVAVTPPYFHDGSAATLDDAVDIMFQYQLGRPAPKADKDLIILFLRTLTGEFRGKPLE